MAPSAFDLADGEKYGMLALPYCLVDDDVPEALEIATGVWICTSLPLDAPSHWVKWIGSLRANQLQNSELVIVARMLSERPGDLDDENETLQNTAHRVYVGLSLTGFTMYGGSPVLLSGARRSGEIDVRQIAQVDPAYWVFGLPPLGVTTERLRQAALIAAALDELPGPPRFGRFWKSFDTYYWGLRLRDPADRLHQFIRAVEGFIKPSQGATESQFKSRTELFIGPRHHPVTKNLYRIRSAVEHLHGPEKELPAARSSREIAFAVGLRSIQAEAMARYCVRNFLLNRSLWPHFETDTALDSFWATAMDQQRRGIWGAPLDLDEVSAQFSADRIPPEDDDDLPR